MVICTIIAKNYLAHARTLAESLRATNPGLPFYVLVIDPFEGCFEPAAEPFNVIGLAALSIPNVAQLQFKYDVTEFATAVKPYLLNYLLREVKVDKVLYLDPDIAVTGTLEGLERQLDTSDYLLTPHLDTDYPDDGLTPTIQSPLRTGAFNLGFFGLRNSPEGLRFMTWLEHKLHEYCIVELDAGYFVDQKFFDVAITLFPGLHIVRDTGYNAGPWNIHSRWLSRESDQSPWLCNGKPLYFYHFSNYKLASPDQIAKYANRYTLANRPDLAALYGWYRERLYQHGYEKCQSWTYTYDHFADGTPILYQTRRYYYGNPALQAALPAPFTAAKLLRYNRYRVLRRRLSNPLIRYFLRSDGFVAGVQS